MIRIVLACQFGASTDLLAVKMQEAAAKMNEEISIQAYSYTKLEQVIDNADIVLLGPQIRFKLKTFQTQFADKNVEFLVIDPTDYGMLNGEHVLQRTLEVLKK